MAVGGGLLSQRAFFWCACKSAEPQRQGDMSRCATTPDVAAWEPCAPAARPIAIPALLAAPQGADQPAGAPLPPYKLQLLHLRLTTGSNRMSAQEIVDLCSPDGRQLTYRCRFWCSL